MIPPVCNPDARARLRHARGVFYTELGASTGRPVLKFRGLPSSSLGEVIDYTKLAEAQVRRITIHRPGVGISDPHPGRTLLDWPDDVRALADSLRLDGFADVGTSGGPPYARGLPRVALPRG